MGEKNGFIWSCGRWRKGLQNTCDSAAQITHYFFLFFRGAAAPKRAIPSSFLRFLDNTLRRITLGKNPLGYWSARHRDLYLRNTQHSQQTDTYIHAPGWIRTQISAGERPQTYALDRAVTVTGICGDDTVNKYKNLKAQGHQMLI